MEILNYQNGQTLLKRPIRKEMDERTKKKIRARKSYQICEQLCRDLPPDNFERALRSFFNVMDEIRAFGTVAASVYARESLELFLADRKAAGSNPEKIL